MEQTLPPHALGVAGLNAEEADRLAGVVMADEAELKHNNTYCALPKYYLDKTFFCVDCRVEEVWTAKQQKWWYEVAKGDINSTAIRCRPCRKIKQEIKAKARKVHLEGLERKK